MKKEYAGMSYEEVVRLFADDITRLCVVWTQDPEEAKDCFQNTFLKLYQTEKEFRDREHLKAWMITVAKNECRDFHKAFWKRNVELGFSPDENAGKLCGGDAETEKLISALHSLPVKFRETLILYYYEGYDTNEIGEILGLSVNTVKSRLRRGREKLAGIMQTGND